MPEALRFSDAEKASFRTAYAQNATDDQWNLFIQECERRALVPGTHVVFQLRNTTEYNAALNRRVSAQKVTLITTINALRLIAQRAGHYAGHGPFIYYYGVEGGAFTESKIPLGKIPHAVSVEGFRQGWTVPLFATARYDAYAQLKDDNGTKRPTQMWSQRGEEQLAKCCEALMLKTIAPEECGGLLISEEIENQAPEESETPKTVVTVPQPTVAPKVNQSAAPLITKDLPEVASTPVLSPISQQASTPVPHPPPVLIAPPVHPTVTAEAASLFTETNRPDPKDETHRFPPMPPVNSGLSNPTPVQAVSTPAPVAPPPASSASEPTGIAKAVLTASLAGVPAGDVPAPSKEGNLFLGRASKIIRDKLPKVGLKDQAAANAVKNYLLNGSKKTALNKISAADWERLLRALEDPVTPEQAAALVTAK